MNRARNEMLGSRTRSQFLFGYRRGHTLIAGSERLSKRLEAVLTRQTDAAAGVTLHDDTHYWSGFPLEDGRYALTSTWSAPEMPRPGCVWSHVILLAREDLESTSSLFLLTRCFRRPESRDDTEWAKHQATLPAVLRDQQVAETTSGAIEVLRAVYGQGQHGRAVYDGSDRHQIAFDVWSQQWADLRQSFSFVTALQEARISTRPGMPRLSFHRALQSNRSAEAVESWLVVLRDALRSDHPLRKLLADAGPEIDPEPSSVRVIARLFAFTHSGAKNEGSKALQFAAKEFPDPTDAAKLKRWLIRTILAKASTNELYDFVEFAVQDPGAQAFGDIQKNMSEQLRQIWHDNVEATYHLAVLRYNNSGISDTLFENFIQTAPVDLLSVIPDAGDWSVRIAFATLRADILANTPLDTAPTAAINAIVERSFKIPSREADRISRLLLSRPKSEDSIRSVCESLDGLAIYLDLVASGDERLIHPTWKEDREVSKQLIKKLIFERRPAKVLLQILPDHGSDAEILGQIETDLIRKYLKGLRGKNPMPEADTIHALILTSALRGRTSHDVKTIRDVAVWIWARMKDSSLDSKAERIVMEHVPYYFLIPPWDHCLRLLARLRSVFRDHYHAPKEWGQLEKRIGSVGSFPDEVD